jgi:nucleotide-binding universal stress UspA family protein
MALRHRIVFATDFSKTSRKAFRTALVLAARLRADLAIVHVIAPFIPIAPEQYVYTEAWDQLERDARRHGQQQLQRLVGTAKRAGVRAVSRLLSGDPARQIARAARADHAQLLVVGTHGRTGLPRLFLGSVASRVIAGAGCPVVIVRGR